MKLNKIFSLFFIVGLFSMSFAQDDLLKSLDSTSVTEKKEMNSSTAFKALQVVNMQSTKTPAKHEFYLLISHRFGNLDTEESILDNFLGMDEAVTKIGGIYGITDWLSVEASRQTRKLYELGTKYRLVLQSDSFPFTLVGRNTVNIDTSLRQATYPGVEFKDKLAFTNQLLVSRKFSERVSLQLAGVLVHKNLIDQTIEKKDLVVTALGGRYKISNRVSINAEYGYRVNPVKSTYDNPASLGLDIDTGGHVFQIVLSNMQKMNDVAYYSGANQGIFLGFNMYRVF